MGEGLSFYRGYGFMGGRATPFLHARNYYFYLWYEVETLQVGRLAIRDVNDVIDKRHL